MGKKFEIQRKIDHEPIIYGISSKYFYLMFFLGILFFAIICLGVLGVGSTGSTDSIGNVFFLALTLVGIYFFMYFYFKKKSKYNKYSFSEKPKYISNRDLNNFL